MKSAVSSLFILVMVASSHGAVSITNQWLLGEDGALVAEVGAVNLTAVGSTTNGAGVTTGGSTVSQSYTNTFGTGPIPAASNYDTATITIGSTNNWGFSMWINPTALPNGTQGEIGILNIGALNLEMIQNGWMIHDTGVAATQVFTGVPLPALNTTFQVSYVNEGGAAKLYVNGSSANVIALNSANNVLIGAMEGNIRGFNGRIDEVTIFTFGAGQFQASDLNTLSPIPEPTAALLGGLGLLGLLRRRR